MKSGDVGVWESKQQRNKNAKVKPFVFIQRTCNATSKGVATPADWQVGQDVIIPVAVNDTDAETKFGKFEKRL